MSNNNNNSDRIYVILGVLGFLLVMSSCAALLIRHITKSDPSKKSSSPSPSPAPTPAPVPPCGIDGMKNGKGTFKIKSSTGKWVYTYRDTNDKMKVRLTDDESKPNVSGWIISNEGTSSLDDIRITSPNGYHFKDQQDEAMRIDSRDVSGGGVNVWKFEGGELDSNNSSILKKVKIKSRYGYYLNPDGDGFKLSKGDKSEWFIICEGPHPLSDTPLTYSEAGDVNPDWNLCTDDHKVIEHCDSNDKCGGAAEQTNGCWHLYEGKGAPWPTGKNYYQKLSFR
jgi:hypothetical protein